MSDAAVRDSGTPSGRVGLRHYGGVIVVEVAVLVAIYLFQWYFGA